MWSLIQARLSYANVISTLALFIAVGGSAYAVGKISGRQLKDRSVSARKIKKHTLTATEINLAKLGKVGSAAHSDFAKSADNASTLSGQPPAAFAPANKFLAFGPTYLGTGGSQPVMRVGPFTLTATCQLTSGGNDRATIVAATAEPNSLAPREPDIGGFQANAPFGPGQQPVLLDTLGPDPSVLAVAADYTLLAPDGTQLTGHLWAGANVLGHQGQCVFGGQSRLG
jgi:hypothetical protein